MGGMILGSSGCSSSGNGRELPEAQAIQVPAAASATSPACDAARTVTAAAVLKHFWCPCFPKEHTIAAVLSKAVNVRGPGPAAAGATPADGVAAAAATAGAAAAIGVDEAAAEPFPWQATALHAQHWGQRLLNLLSLLRSDCGQSASLDDSRIGKLDMWAAA